MKLPARSAFERVRLRGLAYLHIRNQAESLRFDLKFNGQHPSVDDHAVNLDHPRERVISEQLTTTELRIHRHIQTNRVTNLLRLRGHRAFRNSKPLTQLITGHMQCLAGIKQKIVLPDRIDHAG